MKKTKNNPPSEWTKTSDRLPEEKREVITRTLGKWGSKREERLRRKGEFWFFPDYSVRMMNAPDIWRYADN